MTEKAKEVSIDVMPNEIKQYILGFLRRQKEKLTSLSKYIGQQKFELDEAKVLIKALADRVEILEEDYYDDSNDATSSVNVDCPDDEIVDNYGPVSTPELANKDRCCFQCSYLGNLVGSASGISGRCYYGTGDTTVTKQVYNVGKYLCSAFQRKYATQSRLPLDGTSHTTIVGKAVAKKEPEYNTIDGYDFSDKPAEGAK